MRVEIINKIATQSTENKTKFLTEALVAGMLRGNNLVNMQKTMSAARVAKIQALITMFGLQSKPVAGMATTTITLSRMCACFPELTTKLASGIKPRNISQYSPEDYPFCMRTMVFGAMIPSGNSYQVLHDAYLLYQGQLSQVLSKNPDKDANVKVLRKQRNFLVTAKGSKSVSGSRRIAYVRDPSYGICTNANTGEPIFCQTI